MRPSLKKLKGKTNLIGCEIGVARGENAKNILKNLNIKVIYLIDPYERPMQISHRIKQVALENLAEFSDKIIWIYKKSEDVTIEEIPNDHLDFVYINGDHTAEAVKKDLELYFPRIKKGGMFAGHDYNDKAVKTTVDAFHRDNDIELPVSAKCSGGQTDWWTIK